MKAKIWLFASLVSLAGMAVAQSSAVTQSTDPSKIAEIEKHAQDLSSNQPTKADMGTMKSHKKMHRKAHKKMHKDMDKENMDKKAPEGDTPMMEKKG
ncbi:hypothetical protein Q4S45_11145 [Massilia sp. R2A-15]|uniref:hypothetical protein n=1 Tax=Massilia sp. R2A-15 TaxID=3064278 RepID=UPI002734F9B9|nr:hypothetical protein [Massilia sp. R2A-15]WLI91645.1 hypothetical protein Q4S45_11145 [Massilia sp. R2A-15]